MNNVECQNCAFARKPNNHTPWYSCHRYPPVRVDDSKALYSSRWQFPVVNAEDFCCEHISVSAFNSKNAVFPKVSNNEEVYL
jgi:hypothetical protein